MQTVGGAPGQARRAYWGPGSGWRRTCARGKGLRKAQSWGVWGQSVPAGQEKTAPSDSSSAPTVRGHRNYPSLLGPKEQGGGSRGWDGHSNLCPPSGLQRSCCPRLRSPAEGLLGTEWPVTPAPPSASECTPTGATPGSPLLSALTPGRQPAAGERMGQKGGVWRLGPQTQDDQRQTASSQENT